MPSIFFSRWNQSRFGHHHRPPAEGEAKPSPDFDDIHWPDQVGEFHDLFEQRGLDVRKTAREVLTELRSFYGYYGADGLRICDVLESSLPVQQLLKINNALSVEDRLSFYGLAYRIHDFILEISPSDEELINYVNQSFIGAVDVDDLQQLLPILLRFLKDCGVQDTEPGHSLRAIHELIQNRDLDIHESVNAGIGVLAELSALSDNISSDEVRSIIQHFKSLLLDSLHRLRYIENSHNETIEQKKIYRDLGDRRSVNGSFGVKHFPHCPAGVSVSGDYFDYMDETASVNRVKSVTGGINIGLKHLASLGASVNRQDWAIYNTVRDFSMAQAEKNVSSSLKSRIKGLKAKVLPLSAKGAKAIERPKGLMKSGFHRPPQSLLGKAGESWQERADQEELFLTQKLEQMGSLENRTLHSIPVPRPNYMDMSQTFGGGHAGFAMGQLDVSKSRDANIVFTPYDEIFDQHPNLLDDPTLLYSKKIPKIWQKLEEHIAGLGLGASYKKIEGLLEHESIPGQNLLDNVLDVLSEEEREGVSDVVFHGFLDLEVMLRTYEQLVQSKMNASPKKKEWIDRQLVSFDQEVGSNPTQFLRLLQANCARLKRLYGFLTRPERVEGPNPHELYIKDLQRRLQLTTLPFSYSDRLNAITLKEVAHGSTTNYANASLNFSVATGPFASVGVNFGLNRYKIFNCGIPNLDGHYIDVTLSVDGNLSATALAKVIAQASHRAEALINQHGSGDPGVVAGIREGLQNLGELNLNLSGGVGVDWRFSKPDATNAWTEQFRYVTKRTAVGASLTSRAPLKFMSPIELGLEKRSASGLQVKLGHNTMRHLYRRFHSPYGFSKFFAWWEFLRDHRQDVEGMLRNLNNPKKEIRFEFDTLCDQIRDGIEWKADRTPISYENFDAKVDRFEQALDEFCEDSSEEHYRKVTENLTSVLAADFMVLYFDRLLGSYDLDIPSEVRKPGGWGPT